MKLIALTFAGRKRYMEILFPYILKYKKYINEYHLYLATTNQEDIDYIYNFQKNNDDFVKVIKLEDGVKFDRADVWNLSYKNCQDEDAIYLKIDDDIVFIDENLFTNFIDFRKESTAPLVFPHIINNLISTPYLEKYGKLNVGSWNKNLMVLNTWSNTIERIKPKLEELKGKFPGNFVVTNLMNESEILCPIAWGSLEYSKFSHMDFIRVLSESGLDNIYTENIILDRFEPISIQCCSWFGKDLKKYISEFGMVGREDEPWMAIYLPFWSNNPNVIFGKSIVSHFSSYNQDNYLINNGLLEEYKKLTIKYA